MGAAAVASASAFAPMGGLVRPKARTAAVSSLKMQGDFSDAVPFLKRPINLDGEYAGDVGFDPLASRMSSTSACCVRLSSSTGASPCLRCSASSCRRPTPSQIIFWISFVEIFGVVALFETLQGKREPGDFAFDPLGLAKDEATLERYRLAEIKHSRLAMIAI